MRGLGGECMSAGLDHPARFLVKLGRIEAHHAGKRLAVGEAAVGRHQPIGLLGRHFDVIAEDGIVADLQRADAGRVAVSRFERGDGSAAVRSSFAQGIERRVIAFRDVAALRGIDRRRFDHRERASGRPARAWPPRRGSSAVEKFRPIASLSSSFSAAAPASPSRRSARSRGLPRPAASRARHAESRAAP